MSPQKLYKEEDYARQIDDQPIDLPNTLKDEGGDIRSDFRRDYCRLLHSPAFRRMQYKAQMFPSEETDFFRSRLTHSLEVAEIGKSIAIRLNHYDAYFRKNPLNLDLIEFAGLAHDIGHPPFAHIGEKVLDEKMAKTGGFDSNAQTFRILSKLEHKRKEEKADEYGFGGLKDLRCGLNPTFRSLASILKYDKPIQKTRNKEAKIFKSPPQGYYFSDKNLANKIKKCISGKYTLGKSKKFMTVECQIMDKADDIAYTTFDLEDGFKSNFINPFDFLFVKEDLLNEICIKARKKVKGLTNERVQKILIDIISPILKENFGGGRYSYTKHMVLSYNLSKRFMDNGFYRTDFTSDLIKKFIGGVRVKILKKCPALSEIFLKSEVRDYLEVLKQFIHFSLIKSPRLQIPEYRQKQIVGDIFEKLIETDGQLLPLDFKEPYRKMKNNQMYQKRIICDYIAGMSDRYLLEFYGRLISENPQTIFKQT